MEKKHQMNQPEEYFRSLIENAPDMIVTLDANATIQYVSPSTERVLGYSPDMLLGKNVFDIVHPDDVTHAINTFSEGAPIPGYSTSLELRVMHNDGSWHFVELLGKNLLHEPSVESVVINYRDITERKFAEDEIRVKHEEIEVHAHQLEAANDELRHTQQQLLNAYEQLRAVRKIDQLIVREQNPGKLIQTACNIISETRRYECSWIVLLDDAGAFGSIAYAGFGQDFLTLQDRIRTGAWPACAQRALQEETPIALTIVASNCGDCPLTEKCSQRSAFAIRLQHSEDIYGIACFSGPANDTPNDEERDLVEEVAGDIAFALYNIKLEEDRHNTEEEIRAQHEDILVHAYQLEAANDELKHTQNQLIEANQKLRTSEEKYRALFESANDEIIYVNKSGTVIDANKKVTDIFGYTPQEVIGKNFADLNLINPIQMPAMEKAFNNTLQGTGGWGLTELEAKHKDGSAVYIEANISPLQKEGKPDGIMAVIRDVTERKQMQEKVTEYSDQLEQKLEELQKAYEKLKELDKLKDNSLSTVSHELRTPLTSIKSFAEILLAYDNDRETEKEFLTIINDESDRLTRLINDFLDISKIESGHIQWEYVRLEIPQIIEIAVNATQALATKMKLNIKVSLQPNLPHIFGDGDKLVQVMTNLISNAINFTAEGGIIRIFAEPLRSEDSLEKPDFIKIDVVDAGTGIAPEDQEYIFEKFSQVGDTLKDKPPGTGLGLAICKEIVEHHGGNIWVESKVDEGSKFSFTLPVTEMAD